MLSNRNQKRTVRYRRIATSVKMRNRFRVARLLMWMFQIKVLLPSIFLAINHQTLCTGIPVQQPDFNIKQCLTISLNFLQTITIRGISSSHVICSVVKWITHSQRQTKWWTLPTERPTVTSISCHNSFLSNSSNTDPTILNGPTIKWWWMRSVYQRLVLTISQAILWCGINGTAFSSQSFTTIQLFQLFRKWHTCKTR